MRTFNKIFILSLALSVAISCTMGRDEMKTSTPEETPLQTDGAHELGVISIKVTDDFCQELESITKGGQVVLTGVKSMEAISTSLSVVSMERMFPHAGEFEQRTREAGLHKWYRVVFDKSVPLTKAYDSLKELPGAELVEYNPKVVPHNYNIIPLDEDHSNDNISKTGAASGVFNDTHLDKQWHYYNDASSKGGRLGVDINVLPVWKSLKPGSEDVIVSVVDGGIDYTHEDLNPNMWRNPQQSVESFKYGYNFVRKSYAVTPDDHGTHVAGTISAVNNNGKGVCGVAGGDYKKGISGVKLMSCQIFEGNDGADGSTAIKWGADHGAVISQNSWGYIKGSTNATPQFMKDAIDYFNKYAGFDEHGNQVGPMAGGVVIFAAGNDELKVSYPGDYEGCVTVTSVSATGAFAYYTNMGPWADIAAPGGDAYVDPIILSTVPGNKYAYMQGTSMACPHVSGVAALIVSNLGGKGFTNTKLKELLLSSTKEEFLYRYNREQKENKELGVGLVDAYAAIAGQDKSTPAKVTSFKDENKTGGVTLSWTVPASGEGVPKGFSIYYSEKDITSLDPENITDSFVYEVSMLSDGKKVGDKMEYTFKNLGYDKKFHFRVCGFSNAHRLGELSDQIIVTTRSNTPPYIKALDGDKFTVKKHQTISFRYEVGDIDGNDLDLSAKFASKAASGKVNGNIVTITVVGRDAEDGTYQGYLTADDKNGGVTTRDFEYTILPNHAPVVSNGIEGLMMDKSEKKQINLSEIFSDPDGEKLTYTVSNSSIGSVVETSIKDSLLTVSSKVYGGASVTVRATDELGLSKTTTFEVVVRDMSIPCDIYPNPVKDNLYIRSVSAGKAAVRIFNTNGSAVVNLSDVDVAPFKPYKLDVAGFSAGVYSVEVTTKDGQVKNNIVKL